MNSVCYEVPIDREDGFPPYNAIADGYSAAGGKMLSGCASVIVEVFGRITGEDGFESVPATVGPSASAIADEVVAELAYEAFKSAEQVVQLTVHKWPLMHRDPYMIITVSEAKQKRVRKHA